MIHVTLGFGISSVVCPKNLGNNGNNNFKSNMKLFLKNRKFTNEKVNLFGDKLVSYKLK